MPRFAFLADERADPPLPSVLNGTIFAADDDSFAPVGLSHVNDHAAPGGSPIRFASDEQRLARSVAQGGPMLQAPPGRGSALGRVPESEGSFSGDAEGLRGTVLSAPRVRTSQLGKEGLGGEADVPDQEMPQTPYRPDMPPRERKVLTRFSDGLSWKTEDDYFELQFHNLTQLDLREFNPTAPGGPLADNFIIPRQRWYFVGHVSKYVEYYTVINRGYGALDLLDSFADFNFGNIEKDKFQFRVGRMKTPYTYEYIKISESDLIAPERSVFVGNFAGNRQDGAMAHGQVFDQKLEYALGVFDGPRRSFQDFNNSKDLFAFINMKPFLKGDFDLLKQLNLSGSINGGHENNPLQPAALRTANDQSPSPTAANVSPTFLTFNPNVMENGTRMQWAGDVAYYYKSLGILAEYEGGFQDYTASRTSARTRVPLNGYAVTMFYFWTGEQITRRVYLLEPRAPFGTGLGRRHGKGAVELYGRFANLHLGNSVFTGGLANPALWSSTANVVDTGVNWYLNNYTKLTLDWQYSDFGKPVSLSATKSASFMNVFWFRTQIFF
ncbi:MAG TPA: porin [Pirellulales bacterium]|nr:porin [Pirellulales bacterium]